MLQTNTMNDPIVEILRLAYRRGLAIKREQERAKELVNLQPSDKNALTARPEEAERVQANISK